MKFIIDLSDMNIRITDLFRHNIKRSSVSPFVRILPIRLFLCSCHNYATQPHNNYDTTTIVNLGRIAMKKKALSGSQ